MNSMADNVQKTIKTCELQGEIEGYMNIIRECNKRILQLEDMLAGLEDVP